jgi:hypothetical protein
VTECDRFSAENQQDTCSRKGDRGGDRCPTIRVHRTIESRAKRVFRCPVTRDVGDLTNKVIHEIVIP